MILNITDENWAEVIEDTLTVETFTALKKIYSRIGIFAKRFS